jgi:hypothetical protein
MAPQQRSQGDAIGVPDARGNLVDALGAGLQQMHGTFYAEALNVGQGRLAEHRVHAARQPTDKTAV